jgi:hypothetical protein
LHATGFNVRRAGHGQHKAHVLGHAHVAFRFNTNRRSGRVDIDDLAPAMLRLHAYLIPIPRPHGNRATERFHFDA